MDKTGTINTYDCPVRSEESNMTMKPYNPHEIEPRWQQEWADIDLYKVTEDASKP